MTTSVQQGMVSVIVLTRNAANVIEECLQSIRNQSYRALEVIVVDRSEDATRVLATPYCDNFIFLDRERAAAKNVGVEAARGEYLFFCYQDLRLERTVIEECVYIATRTGAQAVVVPEKAFGEGFWGQVRSLEKECYIGDPLIEGARFFTRDAYERFHGTNEQFIWGEEWDLHWKISKAGGRVARISSFAYHNEGKPTLLELLRKKFYYSKTFPQYYYAYPKISLRQIFLRTAYIRHWPRLLRHPILSFGLFVLKCLEFTAFVIGLGIWHLHKTLPKL